MPAAWALEMTSATDRGRVRSQNEDSLAFDSGMGYAVLADGMGGHNAGEVASRLAVATVEADMKKLARQEGYARLAAFEIQRLVADLVAHANAAIYRAARREQAYAGMGTTLVIALWHQARVAVAHVGDSRLYRLRANRLVQLTRDHSLLQDQVDSGLLSREQARRAPHRNLITRAVGIEAKVEAEVHVHDAVSGDLYLLCSDGLTDMLDDRDIERTLARARRSLACAVDALVQQANDRGGRDNISVVLAQWVSGSRNIAGRTPPTKALR